ncbi:MAG: 30S ribosomal protein S15 [Desulfurococcaceae archaeon]|jgi:small subunit ribosomal protein S15|nr:30S ribosomal protein S15 [Desulfurococcaceae archaeon]
MRKGKEKGKSHSTRPPTLVSPKWLQYTPEEIESIIIELAKKGYPPSMIGVILRDQYGVPLTKAVLNAKVTEILRKYNLAPAIPEDLYNLMKKAVNLRRHLSEHPKDKHSLRGLISVESKIHRLVKYYKRVGKLPQDWKYDPEEAKILVQRPLIPYSESK